MTVNRYQAMSRLAQIKEQTDELERERRMLAAQALVEGAGVAVIAGLCGWGRNRTRRLRDEVLAQQAEMDSWDDDTGWIDDVQNADEG